MHLLQRRVPRTVAAALLGVGLLAAATTLPASADDAAEACVSAGNVWVVVDVDGDVSGGCATEFATGLEALASAGFAYTAPGGFVATIDGAPNPAGAQDWWSYWNNTPGDDGVYAGWESYQVGAAEAKPVAGSVEGWRLWHSWETMAEAPTVNPVEGFVLGATQTPTATPTPTVSATATTSASATPVIPGLPHTGN